MEKFIKFIKAHKKGSIIGGIVLIFVILLIILLMFMFPAIGDNNYGDRLDGIEDHKIAKTTISEIKDSITSKDGVDKVSYHNEGRILNFIITLDGSVDLDTAKGYADLVVDGLEKSDLKYYDIQVYLDSKEEKEGFPDVGYRHKTAKDFSWGNVGESSE